VQSMNTITWRRFCNLASYFLKARKNSAMRCSQKWKTNRVMWGGANRVMLLLVEILETNR
jgi:hypothetical protein